MYVCMHVCMYVRMYVCTYGWMYVCMYVFMYVRMYVCMYVRMYVCVYVQHAMVELLGLSGWPTEFPKSQEAGIVNKVGLCAWIRRQTRHGQNGELG